MAEKDRKGPPIDGKQGGTPAATPDPSDKAHQSERQGEALEETFPANAPRVPLHSGAVSDRVRAIRLNFSLERPIAVAIPIKYRM